VKPTFRIVLFGLFCLSCALQDRAQNKSTHNPTWWAKYQYLSSNGTASGRKRDQLIDGGQQRGCSNECGPQSETYITLNTSRPKVLAGGSNEIFEMRCADIFHRMVA